MKNTKTVEKICRNCEFMMFGNDNFVCAAGGETYKYGEVIDDDTKSCDNFELSFGLYQEGYSQQNKKEHPVR